MTNHGPTPDLAPHAGKSKNQFFDLLEALPLIVYAVEPHPPYRPMYVSPGISALGYTRDEWLQIPDRWVRSLDPRDRDRVVAATEDALENRGLLDLEYRLMARDGSTKWFHDRGTFVYNGEGEAQEFRGFLLDITNRKETELDLVGNECIAHEVNNILQVISANASLLVEEVADRPRARAEADEIRRAIIRAAGLMHKLLGTDSSAR